MSEVTLNIPALAAAPGAWPHRPPVPDSLLLATLAAHIAGSARPEELTLTRSPLDEGPSSRVEAICLLRGGIALARAVVKTCPLHTDLGKLVAIAPFSLPVPRILAVLPDHNTVVMEEARGERLDRLMQPGSGAAPGSLRERALDAAARAGIALVAFHRIAPAAVGRLTLARLVEGLRPAPAALPGELGRSAQQVADRLLAVPDPIEHRAALCHRDLHPRQIFDDGSRATFVDLDSIGLAHPALDLANFAVGLEVRHPELAPPLLAAFRAGYAAASGEIPEDPSCNPTAGGNSAQAEAVYRAFTFLRLAAKTCRTQPLGWPERASALLRQAGAALAAAEDRR